MTIVSTKSGKVIKVVSQEEEKSTLTVSDNEMDERAVEAVKAAINRAKICKKPIAGYDKEKKKAYIEYANGERKYAEQKTNDNTETPRRIIRKHKDDLSIYPTEYWSEQDILELLE